MNINDKIIRFGNHLAFRLETTKQNMQAVRWARQELKDIVEAEQQRVMDMVRYYSKGAE